MRLLAGMLMLVAFGLFGPAGCGRASITFALGAADQRLNETTVIDDGGEITAFRAGDGSGR